MWSLTAAYFQTDRLPKDREVKRQGDREGEGEEEGEGEGEGGGEEKEKERERL